MILNREQEIKYYEDKIEELKKELETRFQNPTCNARWNWFIYSCRHNTMQTLKEDIKLFKLDSQLRTTCNVRLSECRYFIGCEYIKVFWDDYVYIYSIKNNHIKEVHDLRYAYLDCFNNFKPIKNWKL